MTLCIILRKLTRVATVVTIALFFIFSNNGLEIEGEDVLEIQESFFKNLSSSSYNSELHNVEHNSEVPHKRTKRVKRIIGGREVDQGKWPFLVSLQGKIPTSFLLGFPIFYKRIHCGASLINDQWILTAAHCFKQKGLEERASMPKYWHAKIGEIVSENTIEGRVKKTIGKLIKKDDWIYYYLHGSKIFIHPQYSHLSLENDIALMKLESRVPLHLPIRSESNNPLAPYLNFIPSGMLEYFGVPKSKGFSQPTTQGSRIGLVTLVGEDDSFLRDDLECIVNGWGCTSTGGKVAHVAREVVMPKVSDELCQRIWGIHGSKWICAGSMGSSIGICPGDSGSPLVCPNGTDWVQVGVASFSSKNKPGDVPGAFARISKYRRWIDHTIQNH